MDDDGLSDFHCSRLSENGWEETKFIPYAVGDRVFTPVIRVCGGRPGGDAARTMERYAEV